MAVTTDYIPIESLGDCMEKLNSEFLTMLQIYILYKSGYIVVDSRKKMEKRVKIDNEEEAVIGFNEIYPLEDASLSFLSNVIIQKYVHGVNYTTSEMDSMRKAWKEMRRRLKPAVYNGASPIDTESLCITFVF